MALCWKLPIENGSLPSGTMASLTSRGFGVVTNMDTVVRGTFGWIFFISVKIMPLEMSDGSSSCSVKTSFLPLSV
jgi:hypothetical protein